MTIVDYVCIICFSSAFILVAIIGFKVFRASEEIDKYFKSLENKEGIK